MSKCPLFSIVIPVYNTERYVKDSIESILNQVDSLQGEVEIILVDDGSTDNSRRICEQYVERFPSKIRLLVQDNQGTSSAKNLGIAECTGELVGFLDSDDRYGKGVLKAVASFASKQPHVDVFAIPMIFFGARKGEHRLNTKFKMGSRVVNVLDDWQHVQLSAASTFIRRETIKCMGLCFKTSLHLAEDAEFVTRAIMRRGRIGLVDDVHYLYRKRQETNSAIDTLMKRKSSYTDVLQIGWFPLLEDFNSPAFGVPRYVQNVVMHDLEWRFAQKTQDVLSSAEMCEYDRCLSEILKFIDFEVIGSQPFYDPALKLYVARRKCSSLTKKTTVTTRGSQLIVGGAVIATLDSSLCSVNILRVNEFGSSVRIEGTINGCIVDGVTFGVVKNGKFTQFEASKSIGSMARTNNGHIISVPHYFCFTVRSNVTISIVMRYPGGEVALPVEMMRTTNLLDFVGSGKWLGNSWLAKESHCTISLVASRSGMVNLDLSQIRSLWKKGAVILVRAILIFSRKVSTRSIWWVDPTVEKFVLEKKTFSDRITPPDRVISIKTYEHQSSFVKKMFTRVSSLMQLFVSLRADVVVTHNTSMNKLRLWRGWERYLSDLRRWKHIEIQCGGVEEFQKIPHYLSDDIDFIVGDSNNLENALKKGYSSEQYIEC
ncbi:glycosyltransferase family 2 protein [Arcanobacterium canis]